MNPLILFAVSLALSACQEGQDRQEVIQKLRTLGARYSGAVVPALAAGEAGTEQSFSLFVALPEGQQIEQIEILDDPSLEGAFLMPNLRLSDQTIEYETCGPLQIGEITATFSPPPASVFENPAFAQGVIQMRYAFEITSTAGSEGVVGDLLYLRGDRPEQEWVNPSVAIEGIEELDFSGAEEISLQMNIENPNQETSKVGWFVSGGRVENRRSRNTTWDRFASGSHCIIATVRGKKSRTFAMDMQTVVVP